MGKKRLLERGRSKLKRIKIKGNGDVVVHYVLAAYTVSNDGDRRRRRRRRTFG